MELENALLAAEMDKARWEEELRDAEAKLSRARATHLQIRFSSTNRSASAANVVGPTKVFKVVPNSAPLPLIDGKEAAAEVGTHHY